MALPLLPLVGLGGALVAWWGKKTYDGISDTQEANRTASYAQYVSEKTKKRLETERNKTNDGLAKYGKQKLDALDARIMPFLSMFKQLKNVELTSSDELERLKVGEFSEVKIAELQHSCETASSVLQGLAAGAAGAAGGALTAFGAYSGTMMFATAGTGTAISTLSGVAATNATLAWLGGGTLAAGGMGVAGGMMVLGGLVAGPALLIFASIFAANASKKLAEAKANMEQAKTLETEVDGVCQKLAMIQDVTNLASEVLSSLKGKMRRTNDAFSKILAEQGVDFSRYDENAKATVFRGVKYAQLLKVMIDTAILNEDGELNGSAKEAFSNVSGAMGK